MRVRVRWIFVMTAVLSWLVLTGIAGADLVPLRVLLTWAKIPPGQERITLSITGSATQWQNGYGPTGLLETREVADLSFEGSCNYLVDIGRVRAGYDALCDAAKFSPTVFGTVTFTRWNPVTGDAETCVGKARFRRGAQWMIGGALETRNVINALTIAPLIDDDANPSANQLIVKSDNPALGCNSLNFSTPQDAHGNFGAYRINKLMPFPGRGSNAWSAPVDAGALESGTATFRADLDVDVERGPRPPPRGGLDGLLDRLQQWWDGEATEALPPPGVIKLELSGGGLQVQWSAGGGIQHARRGAVGHSRSAHSTAGLFTIDQSVHSGFNTLRPHLTRLGRAVLAGTASSRTVIATVTFRPKHGHRSTVRRTYKPIPPPATISSVQFTGPQANPTVIIRGRGLSPLPAQNPVGSPGGHNGCPAETGPTGSDYGLQLQINDLTKGWDAGMSTANNTACIGVIPTRVTPRELDLRLGSFYTQNYPTFTLDPGDLVQVVANGAGIAVHVVYGAPLTK